MTESEELLYNALRFIANDYIELSHEKVMCQRNEYVKLAKKAIKEYHDLQDKEESESWIE